MPLVEWRGLAVVCSGEVQSGIHSPEVWAGEAVTLLFGSLVLIGLGKGFYDWNAMPGLCQIARPKLRSTGYGGFNLVGCISGGAATGLAGAFKEHLGLGVLLQMAAGLMILAAPALGCLRFSNDAILPAKGEAG